MEFKGKVAVVTGASMGIGEALARALAAAGCHLVLAARSVDKIDHLAAELRAQYGVRVLPVPTDVTDARSIQAMIVRAEQVLGGVDILINNAGLGASGGVAEIPEETLRYLFDVNVFGVVRGMQAAIPAMRRRGGGVIVNVGSVVSHIPLPQLGPSGASASYAASKYALRALSLAARAELAGENIQVITLYPGLTRSRFSHNVRRMAQPAGSRVAADADRAADSPKGITGLYNRGRRSLVVPAERVADRTLRAIRHNEREVFISWWDRLAVHLVNRYPGGFDQAMQRAVSAMGGVGRPKNMVTSPAASPNAPAKQGWILAWLAGGLLVLWAVSKRRQG